MFILNDIFFSVKVPFNVISFGCGLGLEPVVLVNQVWLI